MTGDVKAILNASAHEVSPLELLDREDLIKVVKSLLGSGVALSFHGKRSAVEISKKVRPRVSRIVKKFCVGPEDQQARNMLIEGENLQALVTLYKYRGQVDLVVTDPPYNTGQSFRYNDRWDEDPNDPDLGTVVSKEDGSRHTKWIKAMMPRLQMMKAMLKPSGVLAICIDDNELFHLGMMLDEVFGEDNRLAIINWQKTTPKNNRHATSTTEYVLVYARDRELALTELLPRSRKADDRFGNIDKDPLGDWRQDNPSARRSKNSHKGMLYAIQSPFTGELHYPPEKRHWTFEKKKIVAWLQEWGVNYEERDIGDGRTKALVVKGAPIPGEIDYGPDNEVLSSAREAAGRRLSKLAWPKLYFGKEGKTKPVVKVYASEVKAGSVPETFWLEEDDPDRLERIGPVSWAHTETGRYREAMEELDRIVGSGHGFDTVKPLSLIRKIIQIWCPPNGLVVDPYAGSGTTGHAVLALNSEAPAERRFILIEQGAPENADKYARSLTWTRLKNAVTGERPGDEKAEPLGGGFSFRMLTGQINAKAVMAMKRDELIDVILASHWEAERRSAPHLTRLDDSKFAALVGLNDRGEGYFIIWQGDTVGELDVDSYRLVLADAKKAGLSPPYHVYARYEVFQTPSVHFWKVPDKILAHLGLDPHSDRLNDEDVDQEQDTAA